MALSSNPLRAGYDFILSLADLTGITNPGSPTGAMLAYDASVPEWTSTQFADWIVANTVAGTSRFRLGGAFKGGSLQTRADASATSTSAEVKANVVGAEANAEVAVSVDMSGANQARARVYAFTVGGTAAGVGASIENTAGTVTATQVQTEGVWSVNYPTQARPLSLGLSVAVPGLDLSLGKGVADRWAIGNAATATSAADSVAIGAATTVGSACLRAHAFGYNNKILGASPDSVALGRGLTVFDSADVILLGKGITSYAGQSGYLLMGADSPALRVEALTGFVKIGQQLDLTTAPVAQLTVANGTAPQLQFAMLNPYAPASSAVVDGAPVGSIAWWQEGPDTYWGVKTSVGWVRTLMVAW